MGATRAVGTDKTYSTIKIAMDATPGDLATEGGGVHSIQVFADTATGNIYDEYVDGRTGFTNVTSVNYIDIGAMLLHGGKSQEAGGTGILWRSAAIGTLGGCLQTADYTRVHDFEMGDKQQTVITFYVIGITGASNPGCHVYNNIIHDCDANRVGSGILLSGVIARGSWKIYNNAVYDMNVSSNPTGSENRGIVTVGSGNEVINNTVYRVIASGGTNVNVFGIRTLGSGTTKNNYAGGTSNGGGTFEQDFRFDVTGTEDYNVSEDATATGANSITGAVPSDQFISITDGVENFRVKDEDADIYFAGTSVGQLSALDIVNKEWNADPSVGVFEFIEPSAGTTTPLPSKSVLGSQLFIDGFGL